jgi:DNA-binding NtrC family response regulator
MRERVLIVDDDPVQRRLLDDMVRKFGYEPIMAASGDAAMAALTGAESARIDAVVLDLVMPDLDGLGALAKMRAAGLAIPVIVQSSRGSADDLVTAMRAGATDFVIKPVDPGNVRQLENAMFRAVALAQGDVIGLDEFPQIVAQPPGSVGTASVVRGVSQPAGAPRWAESPPIAAPGNRAPPLLPAVAATTPPAGMLALVDGNGDMRPLDHIEADAIRFAIAHYRGQMSEVARRLRIGRSTLYRKLDSLERR